MGLAASRKIASAMAANLPTHKNSAKAQFGWQLPIKQGKTEGISKSMGSTGWNRRPKRNDDQHNQSFAGG